MEKDVDEDILEPFPGGHESHDMGKGVSVNFEVLAGDIANGEPQSSPLKARSLRLDH